MEQQTVHLFVLDGMADWEPGFAIAGINQPAYQIHPGRYQVSTLGGDARADPHPRRTYDRTRSRPE